MTVVRAIITGCGSYLPAKILANQDLIHLVDTSDEWIVSRTGIQKRHIIGDTESTSDMAAQAAKKAIEHANIPKESIDLIIVATTTPDNVFPATAVKVQALLGLSQGAAFDVQAVCAGFVYALSIAYHFIISKTMRRVLVIGADAMSRIVDWQDRSSCVLFGDGAGAVILEGIPEETAGNRGILHTSMYSNGNYEALLYAGGGAGSCDQPGKIQMVGKEVFKHAVEKMTACVENLLSQTGLSIADIDWLVPHQANVRILEAVAKKLALPTEKIIMTVAEHANTSAASIPLALDKAVQSGCFQPGQLIVLEAIGGGLCWGGCALRW